MNLKKLINELYSLGCVNINLKNLIDELYSIGCECDLSNEVLNILQDDEPIMVINIKRPYMICTFDVPWFEELDVDFRKKLFNIVIKFYDEES
ncbi:MAG: hypothetical protein PUG84_01515 [Peptoniphilaceae bacterium]|nr:hypothetical protein [Peptoniphilaceae bacterium]